MGERIERETPVLARSRIAQRNRGPGDSQAMHTYNEQESTKTQNELLQRKINQNGTGSSPLGELCTPCRYFFKLIFCCASRSKGSSLSPTA